MTDIAQLGFRVDSKPVADAAVNLDKMEAAGRKAQSGVEKILAAIQKQTAEIQKLNSATGASTSNTERMAQAQMQAAKAVRATNDEADRQGGALGKLTGLVKGFIAAWASFRGAQALQQMADTWSDLTSRVRLSIGAHESASGVMDRLSVIARQTYSSFELTAESFTRNATTLNALGKSTQQQLDYTQALNNALVVSGAKGQQAELVMNGLSRAMAEGALKGDDLNLILNYGSRVAQMLADELGVNVTQLRGLAKEGKITGEVIFQSLVKNMEAVTAEAESMPATIGDAFTLIRNAVLQTVGVFDQQNQISQRLAESLIVVADNMGEIVKVLAAVVTGFLAYLVLSSPLAMMATAIAGLVALYLEWADNTEYVSQANRELIASVDAAAAATSSGSAASVSAMAGLYEETQARLALAKAALAEAEAKAIVGGLFWTESDLQAFREARANVDALTAATDRMEESFGNAAVNGVRRFLSSLFDVGSATAELETLMGKWNEKVTEAERRVREHTEGTAEYRQELANLILTKAADAGQTAEQIAALRAQLEQGAAILAQADNLRTARSSAAAAAREQAQAEREAAQAQRELEQAARAAHTAYMAQLQVLDPLLAMELQHAAALKELASWYAMGVITAEQYAERKAMAVQTSEQAVQAFHRERDVLGQVTQGYQQELRALQMTARQAFVYAQAQDAITRAAAAGLPLQSKQIKLIEQMAGELYDAREAFGQIEELLSEFGDDAFSDPILDLVDGIKLMREEIEKLSDPLNEAFNPERAEEMERALGRMNARLRNDTLEGYRAILGAAQAFTKEGSRGFKAMEAGMAALSIVQDVLAMKAAITAILSQGNAPPPMSFAAMAAMAAAVAPLLASIGLTVSSFSGSGGGFVDTAEQRQATQGTGTVLGDAEAKSESIANAIQITADATSELVGINRGMLNALIALQSGIGSATGMLARGAGNVDFDTMVIQPLRHAFLGSVFTPMLRFLSGSSQITDRGIMIGGGGVGNLNPQAYQEEQYRTWRFGSRRTREQTAALPGNVAAQFDLIMQSIVDTVREAATALGLVPEDIEAAIAAYEVEVTRISLSDLSAEEQQAELEAVFSAIFDGLAGAVVPFVEQFQQVGEGLGETLVRVATGVQVMQEAVRRLGFSLDETDPERFAQVSEALIEMSGGLEGFIAGMSSFLDKFAPESHRFAVAQDELTRAFEQAGLTVPATRDAMWELMQSLDSTTEEGREQIATLLRLSDVANEYYRLLERRGSLDEILMQALRGDWSGPIRQLQELDQRYRQAMADAEALGAGEAELGMIRRYFTRQALRLADQLMQSALQLAQQLGYITGVMEQGLGQTEIGAIGEVSAAVEDRYARELQLLQQLDQFVRSLSTSALSPLTPRQQMNAARQEYERLLALAQGGDLDALGQLQGAAQTYLQQAQGFYGGVGPYEQIFQDVQATLAGIVAAGPQSEQIGPQTPVFGGPVTVEPGEGWAQQNAIERAMLAQQLVDHLAALSIALNTPVLELMETLGIPIAQLAADLGVEISNLTGQAVETLAQLAYDLGLPLGELVQALGLNLPDLADGLRELTDQLGIDLGDLSAETAGQLAALAGNLRTDLTTLTTALGIDLGRLVDANSPIFLALEQTIDSLSPAIRDQLSPLLQAVRNATTEADARAAVDAARDAINAMPVGIRAQLAPYFEDIAFPGDLSELTYLSDIDMTLDDLLWETMGSNNLLQRVASNLQAANQGNGFPAFAAGGMVSGPTLAWVGEAGRELVLPNSVTEFFARNGIPINTGGAGSDAMLYEMRSMRRELYELKQQMAEASRREDENLRRIGDSTDRSARANERAADKMEMRG